MKITDVETQSPATFLALKQMLGEGPQGPQGRSAYQVAVDNGFVGNEAAWLASLGPSLPLGGTIGQALRKLSAADGDADWSTHWVVDPTTGRMTQTPADRPYSDPIVVTFVVGGHKTTAPVSGVPGIFERFPLFQVDDNANLKLTQEYSRNLAPVSVSTQTGNQNFQQGSKNTQSGFVNIQRAWNSTQAGSYNYQTGYTHTQSGFNNFQSGSDNTQSGSYNFQSAIMSTQSGFYGLQVGGGWSAPEALNDGGFSYTFMVGKGKTANVAQRAYFALDNGIWLKPFAGDAASPENGVLHYNSTLGKFRAYEGGAWKNLIVDNAWQAADGRTEVVVPPPSSTLSSYSATWTNAQKRLVKVESAWKWWNWANTVERPFRTLFDVTRNASINLERYIEGVGYTPAEPSATASFRIATNGGTQSGFYNFQMGNGSTQSGLGNIQNGNSNTQSGRYSIQQGAVNTQAGDYGTQSGYLLNDGGFDYTAMFGFSKTATVGHRAYFALDNGIWLKPFAGDAASPENGVIGYNSTLGKFRFYQSGGWKSYLTETDPSFNGTRTFKQATPLANGVVTATSSPILVDEKVQFVDDGFGVGAVLTSRNKLSASGSMSLTYGTEAYQSSQTGFGNFQIGYNLHQQKGHSLQVGSAGNQNTFSGAQVGSNNTQSGGYNFQSGYGGTQSGYYNFQSGQNCTQSGTYSFQAGDALNDAGFSAVFMVGRSKTATAAKRAYFALDNGIWLKPVATAPASPENGVIYYDSVTHKFRGYANGAWVDLH